MRTEVAASEEPFLPVTEVFHSLQGEGMWTGTPMLFIRLAGCNVGRAAVGNPWSICCTTTDGQTFRCDTDYRRQFDARLSDIIVKEAWEHYVCITGGEPFMHSIPPLLQILGRLAYPRPCHLHFETSGTKPIPTWTRELPPTLTGGNRVWCACSPKKGFLIENRRMVDEWKFLVGPNFRETEVAKIVGNSSAPVFIQPVDPLGGPFEGNLQRCLDLQRKYPDWRLSFQAHKLLNLR